MFGNSGHIAASDELPATVIPSAIAMDKWRQYEDSKLQVWVLGTPQFKNGEKLRDLSWLSAELQEKSFDQVFKTLQGRFAIVVRSKNDQKTWICSDRFASHKLFYVQLSGGLVISDKIDSLLTYLPSKPQISNESVVNYLFYHMIPSPGTIYEGIYSIEPAEILVFQNGEVKKGTYWSPGFTEDALCSEQDYASELHDILHTVCGDEVKGRDTVGCFLSGGLDSSSISGMAGKHKPGIDVFSIGFPIEQYNEIDYARTAASHFGLKGHEYFMTPEDVVGALPDIVASMSQPFGNSSVVPTYFCAKLAKENGVSHLIAGDGGDELFAGNERYSHQLKMERWKRRLGPVLGLLDLAFVKTNWPETLPLASKAKSFTRQLNMTVPERLEYFNFLNLQDRRTIFSSELISTTDIFVPERQANTIYQSLNGVSDLNRMLYLDWKHTLADNDLIKVNDMCQLAGVDVSYPMLDQRLVDFSLTVPSDLKLIPSNLRHLYKLSMKDFLPEKIINKPKHGFGLPFGVWTADHADLRSLAYDAIDSLKSLNLFHDGFIDEVKRQHQEVHAKHYGELVWVLMILALWLDRHQS
ncbi:MAG: asparagine synthase-related protein [Motiliproteus sp.]|nr:asparagine synthase-related protein [Motiliproteus sp.]MCW9053170.1 asparagine synthase-related protein [Motiliproteus sp.]